VIGQPRIDFRHLLSVARLRRLGARARDELATARRIAPGEHERAPEVIADADGRRRGDVIALDDLEAAAQVVEGLLVVVLHQREQSHREQRGHDLGIARAIGALPDRERAAMLALGLLVGLQGECAVPRLLSATATSG
jgi:hypothetical protein